MSLRNVRASRLSIAALACGAAAPALSQAQPPPAPGPCAAPEHHQFDFWLGDWEVRTPEGKLAGHNTISRFNLFRKGKCPRSNNEESSSSDMLYDRALVPHSTVCCVGPGYEDLQVAIRRRPVNSLP